MPGEALKGHLDLLLLSVLEHEALHRCAVIERLKRRSEGVFDLPEGTVYPALHRLEQAGLLSSRWSNDSGRRRRVYRLTRRGAAALERERPVWRSSRAVSTVAGGAG